MDIRKSSKAAGYEMEEVSLGKDQQKRHRKPERLPPGARVCPLGSDLLGWCPGSCFYRKIDAGSNTDRLSWPRGAHSPYPLLSGSLTAWVGDWRAGQGDQHHSGFQ